MTKAMIRATLFIRCRTCGRYLAAPAAIREVYCSETCAESFTACPTCGKYFSAGRGYRGKYCSQACSIQYRLNRSFGPEPVLLASEELE